MRRAGALIGFLAFRFGISGVYFALLTIAFAEFTRIGFDHLDWLGGPGGLFLKVAQRDHIDLLSFRGPPAMYYYAMLRSPPARSRCARWLLRSRAGYYWQAIRENEDAAQALGIDTSLEDARGRDELGDDRGRRCVLRLLLQQPVPRADLQLRRSIEIILGPIIGGIGTLFGPIVGAAALTLLGDGTTELLAQPRASSSPASSRCSTASCSCS